MAAAYAALVSLMNTMENMQNHPRLSTSFDKYQIESLSGKVDFLLDFIENYSHGGTSKETEDLERQIASAAREAEDVIESHITDRMKVMKDMEVEDLIGKSAISMPDLQKVIENMDSIKEKVMEAKEEGPHIDQQSKSPMREASSRPLTTGKTAMVGFDSYLVQLLDWLTGQKSVCQIISITGMGGIGKTTLGRNIYEDLLIVQHFDVLAWVTTSQECNVTEILRETLSCLRGPPGGMDTLSEDELGEQLYKSLSGRRYLVILDDIWSIEAWDKIKIFFPDNCNRSRIVATTRISSLANHFGSLRVELDMLDGDQSWNLFCQEVFRHEGCLPELEKIEKEIVEKCKGLPLSISVIGGLLRNSSKTQQYWEDVAKDSSILNSTEDSECFNILYLSYSYLPACLKPCFLYLGIFPKDREIRLSRLIKLWIADGLLKLNKD